MPRSRKGTERGLWASLLLFVLGASTQFTTSASAAFTKVYAAPMDVADNGPVDVRPVAFSRGLFGLEHSPAGFASSGTVILPAVPTPAFDSLVLSWNADVPSGTVVEVQGRVHRLGAWSEWYTFGRQTHAGGETVEKEGEHEWMDVDTLKLRASDQRADAFQVKAVLTTALRSTSPVVSLLAATVADSARAPLAEPDWAAGPWVRELDVPARSQMTEQAAFARDICSPTSLSMAMAFHGRAFPTAETAVAVQDRRSLKYGVWPLNTAWAAAKGLRAWVSYLNKLTDLQEEVAAGFPVVVSISFEPGGLEGSPINRTRGHLLVVRGFTAAGDVIVNDPAAPEAASARRVYKRAQFRKSWLENKRGLSYLLRPRWPVDLAVGVEAADLRASPSAGDGSAMDRGRLTQLVTGEAVRVLAAPGEFARVEAVEQAHASSGTWGPYPGWIETGALATPSSAMKPNAVVASTAALTHWATPDGNYARLLPMGAEVMRLSRTGAPLAGEAPGLAAVRLFDGLQAGAPAPALASIPLATPAERRARALASARLLLGRAYRWGGRSSTGPGVDCSGLVSLAYRTAGVDVPRDAHDQFLKAAQQDKPGAAGDLLFLSKPGKPESINHVAFVGAGETLLEAVEDGGVRETTFFKRLGKPRARIRSGDVVGGRTVYFGAIIP